MYHLHQKKIKDKISVFALASMKAQFVYTCGASENLFQLGETQVFLYSRPGLLPLGWAAGGALGPKRNLLAGGWLCLFCALWSGIRPSLGGRGANGLSLSLSC